MLISQPNLPGLFRLRQWAQLTFETDCQNVQIAQVTFLLQVICGLCAVKPQKCAHSYGHYICAFLPPNWLMIDCLLVEEIEFRRVWYWSIFLEKEQKWSQNYEEDQWNWYKCGCPDCRLMLARLVLRRANKKDEQEQTFVSFSGRVMRSWIQD